MDWIDRTILRCLLKGDINHKSVKNIYRHIGLGYNIDLKKVGQRVQSLSKSKFVRLIKIELLDPMTNEKKIRFCLSITQKGINYLKRKEVESRAREKLPTIKGKNEIDKRTGIGPIKIVITSHARLRMKERGINLESTIKWLHKQPVILLSKTYSGWEINLPFKGRLAGNFSGNTFSVITALPQDSHSSRLRRETLRIKVESVKVGEIETKKTTKEKN